MVHLQAEEAASHVDPWIGTEGAGNTIIGPSLPFGMIKPGPDTGKNDRNSGWGKNGDINGFSQTHVNGTGGGCKYGNILIQPITGLLVIGDTASPREEEQASLCYYTVKLKRYDIQAEVTTAERAAIYRFTYPANEQSRLVFDVGHCLTGGGGERQNLVASSVKVLSPTEVAGSSGVVGGWNKQTVPYTVYFYAVTDTPASGFGVWQGEEKLFGERSVSETKSPTGAWLDFATTPGQVVRVKIGISFVSIEQAKANAGQITGFDFQRTLQQGIETWNQALGKIRIAGGTPQQKRMFYTCLYRAMLMPVDRSGENPLWQSSEPYYDDFYAIWDTFRSSAPLLTLIAPERQSEMVRALIDIQRREGFLPDARSGNFNGRTQGGSNADILIADAYVKKLPGIDWEKAYAAVMQDAEVAPANQFKEGRGGLDDWHKLGYCSMEGVDRSPGKSVEYAYDDFCIAQMAQGMGKAEDTAKYFKRAGQWQNLWDADFSDSGFSGFIRSRHRNGEWKRNFTARQGCSWNGDTFYEGNSWTYSFFVPQDVAALITKCGGPETFVRRLDTFFGPGGRCDVSNEPFFLTPYLYIWAGRPDKTAERVHQIVARATPNGMPGNDDSGAMSSWYVFGALGFFPNAGQDFYLLGTPLFPSASLTLGNGQTFTITAENLSDKNIYIVGASLNGKAFDRAWISHGDLMAGGQLVLQMAEKPAAWPTGPLPPSPLSAVK
jgi:predicted alpha-1,2-mannosidase